MEMKVYEALKLCRWFLTNACSQFEASSSQSSTRSSDLDI